MLRAIPGMTFAEWNAASADDKYLLEQIANELNAEHSLRLIQVASAAMSDSETAMNIIIGFIEDAYPDDERLRATLIEKVMRSAYVDQLHDALHASR